MGQELGIERAGFVEGSIFVLKLQNVPEWGHALTEPLHTRAKGRKERRSKRDPFASASIKAEYKGFGSWRVRAHTSDALNKEPCDQVLTIKFRSKFFFVSVISR